jgi:hypothetical protein
LGHYPGNQPTKDPNHPFPILNHHNWSWYIQWMILDGLEGDPSAWCDAAGWFLCCRLWKIQLAGDSITELNSGVLVRCLEFHHICRSSELATSFLVISNWVQS